MVNLKRSLPVFRSATHLGLSIPFGKKVRTGFGGNAAPIEVESMLWLSTHYDLLKT